MNRKKVVTVAFVVLAICLLAGIFIYGIWHKGRMLEKKKQQEQARMNEQKEDWELDDADAYTYNYNLTNILFMGIDTNEEFQEREAGWAGQSDSLVLMSMDKNTKEIRLLEISRDSMADIEIYDRDGERTGSQRMQISTQFAYGDGKKRSCQLTMNAVSNLLYEIPIHSYVAINIDGIAKITELMGGVTLTVPEDYTAIDPDFKKGATITLQGKQAERYVRYRDTSVSGSNSGRMERQEQFIEALIQQLEGKSVSWYQKIWSGAEDDIITDITVDEMEKLAKFQMHDEIYRVPGEVQSGERYDEFIVDSKKLKEIMLKLFYKTEN